MVGSSSPVVVRVHDVSKQFRIRQEKSLKERLVNARRSGRHQTAFVALDRVSCEIRAGETVGLIGHNGSGKSTLLKLIGGILTPTSGYVERRGRLAALLELGAGFHGDLTGRENVYLNAAILGLSRTQTDAYFDEIIDFSGIEEFIDTQVKFYSSGMYVRLAFAVAVHVEPEVLLVDEVLAVGDEPFQRKCLERIKRFQREGRTIVLVTHGLDQVRQLCDRAILLDHGKVVVDGTALEAIRTFRERFSDEAETTTDLAETDPRPMGVVIEAVRLIGPDGAAKASAHPGDALSVEVDVRSRAYLAEWTVGIALENHMDQLIYGTTNLMLQTDLPPLIQGCTTISFAFDQLPLPEGHYYVTAAVADAAVRQVYHRLNRAAHLRVSSRYEQDGVVYLEPTINVRVAELTSTPS